MSKQKKPPVGRGRPKADNPMVHAACRVAQGVLNALESLAKRNRRSRSAEMALAIEEWLRKNGEPFEAPK
jgi:hypothetical protein